VVTQLPLTDHHFLLSKSKQKKANDKKRKGKNTLVAMQVPYPSNHMSGAFTPLKLT